MSAIMVFEEYGRNGWEPNRAMFATLLDAQEAAWEAQCSLMIRNIRVIEPDHARIAAAVKTWLDEWGDEADIALEAVLVEEGVHSATDGAYYEPGAREHNLVHIFLEDGRIIQVNTDGSVDYV